MKLSEAPPEPLRIGLVGGLGKMGAAVQQMARASDRFAIAAILDPRDRPKPSDVDAPAHVTPSSRTEPVVYQDPEAALARVDVVIDFSAPSALTQTVDAAVKARTPYLLASTGLGRAEERAVEDMARTLPVIVAANLSPGVNVLLHLARIAAESLPSYDLEILEIHHRRKRDAPSGTARALRDAMSAGRPGLVDVFERSSTSVPRRADDLGFAVIRGGDVVGDHTVFLLGDEERLELCHRANDRRVFARGALQAAAWLVGKAPGRYAMSDVLGLRP